MWNLGPGELLLILAIALIVFGPKKLPEIGRGLGNALREFNRARNDFMETLHSVDLEESSRSTDTARSSYADSEEWRPGERKVEYPQPLETGPSEALPYGGVFHTAEGDSQPSFRTVEPEPAPVAAAASAPAHPAPVGPDGATSDRKA